MKDREAVMKELFDLKRASGTAHAFVCCNCLTTGFLGFKSNYEDFKCKVLISSIISSCSSILLAYIDYQARLQHLDDRDTLSRTCHTSRGVDLVFYISFQLQLP